MGMNYVISLLNQILAIEKLEYYNKNHLSGDNESRSRKKIEMLEEVLKNIDK